MTGTQELYLSIDQGGHATRAILFTATGELCGAHEIVVETHVSDQDFIEHDPEEIVDSVRQAVAGVLKKDAAKQGVIRAAGLATQRSSMVCWDRKTGQALSPVISWQDRRAALWLKNFRSSEARVREITGLVLSPHYGASKMRWCLDHLLEVKKAYDGKRLACAPLASFILFRLLEEQPFVVDPSHGSRTLLLDLATKEWSQELADLFGIDSKILPECVPNEFMFGRFRNGDHLIPLTVCTGDQSAALFTNGDPSDDTFYCNVGTGAFVLRTTEGKPPENSELLRSLVWQDMRRTIYAAEGTVNGAGAALEIVGSQLGYSADKTVSLAREGLLQNQRLPLFLNGVGGLGSPFWSADFPTRFVDTGHGDSKKYTDQDKLAAVIESIVFLLAVNVGHLKDWGDGFNPPKNLYLSGGLARLDSLCQRLADLCRLECIRPQEHEATARGLAFLLAGRPKKWAPTAATQFSPQQNSELERRFQLWSNELFATLKILQSSANK